MPDSRNKFRLTRFILLRFSWVLKFFAKFRQPRRRILIIKLDAIGDYILFRNYLQFLHESHRFQDYEIELLGNQIWKDIALKYDNQFVSKFHFINEKPLYQKPLDVLRIGWMLFKRNYEVVLQSTYSRTLVGNGLAGLAAAKETIAFNSLHELYPEYKKQADKLYSTLLTLPESAFHEYHRNENFFKQITTQKQVPFAMPSLPVINQKREVILIFPGSSVHKRNWEKNKFIEIIKRLLDTTNLPIIIAGGYSEIPISSYIFDQLPASERLKNETGKSTLPDLIELIANSKFIISNETSAIHIAAATRTPSVCILGGGHFERFTPYPESMEFKPVCVYQPMDCYNCDWKCKFNTSPEEPFPCISGVSIESVWMEVQHHLDTL